MIEKLNVGGANADIPSDYKMAIKINEIIDHLSHPAILCNTCIKICKLNATMCINYTSDISALKKDHLSQEKESVQSICDDCKEVCKATSPRGDCPLYKPKEPIKDICTTCMNYCKGRRVHDYCHNYYPAEPSQEVPEMRDILSKLKYSIDGDGLTIDEALQQISRLIKKDKI